MKNLILTVVAAALALPMLAAPLTPEQALQRCTQAPEGRRMAAAARFTAADLVYTARDAEQAPAVYLFARQGQGFLVTSADDVALPVLAYGDNEASADRLPDNLLWWLGEYAREIAWAKANPQPVRLDAPQRPERAPVAPLVKARWNQGAPYNILCPEVNGRKTYTGCVATAMAQVMKHHNWPPTGNGSNSYTWNGKTLSMDFSQTTFDWDNMAYIYNDASTAVQDTAVALLMQACGYAVNMNYGLSGSGAMSSVVPGAMRRYFRYGKSTTQINRDYVPLLDWEEYIYNSLAANAPCYYSGQNLSVGHAFVCDGYSADGYFHFNWGWGGMSDGYYLLTALNPRSQGIGGSTNGYNINQSVILNALPETLGSEPMVIFSSDKAINCSYDTVTGAMALQGAFYNIGAGPVTVELGVKVENMATGQSAVYGTGRLQKVNSLGAAASIKTTVPNLAQGLYNLTPMVSTTRSLESRDWQPMLMPLGQPTTAYMLIDADTVEFQAPDYALLSVDSLVLETPAYVNSNYKVRFHIDNELPDEVYEHLIVALVNSSNQAVSMGDPYAIDLQGGQGADITYMANFGNVAAGDYTLAVCQLYGNGLYIIGEPLPVTLTVNSVNNTFSLSNLTIRDAGAVDCSDIRFSFDFNNTQGYFASSVTAAVAPATGGTVIQSQAYDPLFLDGEKTEHLSYAISVPGLEIGKSYMLALFVNNRQHTYTTFTVATDAVETIEGADGWSFDGTRLSAPASLASVSVYSADGMRRAADILLDGTEATISTASLAPGIYLLRAATAGDARTFRLLVR